MTKEKAEYVCPEDKNEISWVDIILDEWQQNEVSFSRIHMDKYNRGACCYKYSRVLIATLAKAIDLLVSPKSAIRHDVHRMLVNAQGCFLSDPCKCPKCTK